MIGTGVTVELPGGVWRNGARRRDARLRPVDARLVLEVAEDVSTSLVAFSTRLLADCLEDVAGETPVSERTVSELGMGDREALLLHLHRISYGDFIDLFTVCPQCGIRMEISVSSSDLLLQPYRWAPSTRRRRLEIAGQSHEIRFRLPTAADLDSAIGHDDASAVRQVLERCVLSISPKLDLESLLLPLGRVMADLDPQAELIFNLSCPECETRFVALLDMSRYVRNKVRAEAKRLLWEIHVLASAYHWSESEVLSLTSTRRHRYLDLIESYGAAG